LGLGANAPNLVTVLVGSSFDHRATEDGSGVYWLDGDGTLYRCRPDSCSLTKKVLAVGQSSSATLYQDATALYWANSDAKQIMRLAK